MATPTTRPFLKWPGGKYRLVPELQQAFSASRQCADGKLIEPFVGSAAVFLNTGFDRYLLGDTNTHLIGLYEDLRDGRETFMDECAALFHPDNNTAARYYALRDEFNNGAGRRRRSALFLYLNRHGYNGLCRYNSRGEFNTPFGQMIKPYFPRKEMVAFLQRVRRKQTIRFVSQGFRETMLRARRGDIVYCDPPYVPLSRTASFTDYHAGGFGWQDQEMLAATAARLAQRGVRVVVSNHDTAAIRRLYSDYGARLRKLNVRRSISCNGSRRALVGEIIATFREPREHDS
ncbi:DNA adenine methylase [Methylohalomonas lacus]|uniref:Site-specific DNA-methyltransferase (adenine-specific) n=1 Tax=Methylohalomonas lacus TaxID=398773 RepID=A0AAE3L102_9GAMM|nr:Dam family site-specific DNA-(adenine-N6)-methyltransferase [Methylohalomonas lacus]MCS3902890.1 DNA adenine methylase [Methylohalomonas lacus]